jgi:hypothetical protein
LNTTIISEQLDSAVDLVDRLSEYVLLDDERDTPISREFKLNLLKKYVPSIDWDSVLDLYNAAKIKSNSDPNTPSDDDDSPLEDISGNLIGGNDATSDTDTENDNPDTAEDEDTNSREDNTEEENPEGTEDFGDISFDKL